MGRCPTSSCLTLHYNKMMFISRANEAGEIKETYK